MIFDIKMEVYNSLTHLNLTPKLILNYTFSGYKIEFTDEQNNLFVGQCKKIMENKLDDVSKTYLDIYQNQLMKKEPEFVIKIMEDIFDDYLSNTKNSLHDITNNACIKFYVDEYYKFKDACKRLKSYLNVIDKLYIKNLNSKFGLIQTISIISYSKLILEYFFLGNDLNFESMDTEIIIKYTGILLFFDSFSKLIQNESIRNSSFISFTKLLFLDIPENANIFINKLTKHYHEEILLLNDIKDPNELNKKISHIRYVATYIIPNIINNLPDVSKKNIFMVQYKKYLMERLNKINPSIEKELLNNNYYSYNPELFLKIKNIIEDSIENKNKEQIENINFKTTRQYDWDNYDVNDCNLNPVLSSLIGDYKKKYEDSYKNREIYNNYISSEAVLEVTYDKTYKVNMNVYQLNTFIYINENPLTIEELQAKLNTKQDMVKIILNSLQLCNLIKVRPIDGKYYISPNFTYKSELVSIRNIFDKVFEKFNADTTEKPILKQKPSNSFLRGKVLHILTIDNISDFDKITNKINETLDETKYSKITVTDLDSVIADLISSNLLTLDDTGNFIVVSQDD